MKQSAIQSLSSTPKNKIKSITGKTYKSASAKADKLWKSKFRLWSSCMVASAIALLVTFSFNEVRAQTFTAGNLAVFVVADGTANNTTGSIYEILPATATQSSPVHSYSINGTSGGNALRFTGSGSTPVYLSNSNDGTLLVFTGANTTSTGSSIKTYTTRGEGTLNSSYTFNLATTYTGVNGNNPEGVTTLNNSTFYIGDQGGLYTNGTSSPTYTGTVLVLKSFGGTVYEMEASAGVATVSSPTASSVTALPGSPKADGANCSDFCLISSGSNGSTYDILYIVINTSPTAGVIYKYSLVSGSWTANSTKTTSFGGKGIAAAKQGSGAYLYVSSADGATPANSLIRLTDAAGYNANINVTTGNNVTLYTAMSPAMIKGVAFAPVAAPTIGVSPTSVTICSGSSTTLTASCSASCTGISYSWSNGATTSAITVTPGSSNTYTVTATNSTGGTATATSAVTVNNTPAVSISPSSASICSGNSTTLSANCTANCTGVTYLWSPGNATTSSITVSSANTYSLTSTANSCSVTATAVVSSASTPSTPTVTDNSNSCGSSVLATTATGTLLWNTGASTSSITVTDAGTYSVTTTVGGCPSAAGTGSAGGSFRAIPSSPTPASNSGPFCIGGTLSLSATAVSGATYSWTGPNSFTSTSLSPTVSANATIAMAGTYSITATVGGCTSAAATTTASNFISFSDNAETGSFSTNWTAPSGGWAYNSTPSVITGTKSINNTASAGASTDYLYTSLGNIDLNNGSTTWQMNLDYYGTGPTGSANYYLYYLVADGTNLGSVQNGWGVGISNPTFGNYDLNLFKVVSGTITLAKQIGTGVNPLCSGCTGNVGVKVTRSSAGVWSLQYDNTTTTFSALSSVVSYTETSPPPHAYSSAYSGLYFFYNASGSNFGMDNLSFMQGTPTIAVSPTSPIICSGSGGTTLTASCSANCTGITYIWSPGSATTSSITATSGGTYSVTATITGGCPVIITSVVTSVSTPSAPTVTDNSNSCGSSVLATTATGTLLWNTGASTSSITVTDAGTYSVTTTVGGCTSAAGTGSAGGSFKAIPSSPTPASNNGPFCIGGTLNLSATVVSGATYSWTGPNSFTSSSLSPTVSSAATVAMAGTYSITATVSGCTSAAATTTASNLISFSDNAETGTFSTNWTAPSGGWAYNSSPSVITGTKSINNTASNGPSTDYLYTGLGNIDLNNASTTWQLNLDYYSTGPTGSANYYLYYLVADGTNLSSVQNGWGVGISNPTFGNYDLNLFKVVSGTITLAKQIGTGVNPLCSGCTGNVGVVVTRSATGVWSLQYDHTTTTFSALSSVVSYTETSPPPHAYTNAYSGLYFFYNASNGNFGMDNLSFVQGIGSPAIAVSPTSATICSGGSGQTITASCSANCTGIAYSWSPGGATTSAITATTGGTYSVTATITGGCPATATSVITSATTPATPVVSVTNNCGSSILSTTATGTLLWNTGATASSITVTVSSTYSVTATTGSCTSPAGTGTSAPKSVPATPVVTVNNLCNGTSTLSTTATGSLLWTGGTTTSSITVTSAGTYSVTQTVNTCASTAGTGTASAATTPSIPVITVVDNCGNSVLSTTSIGTLAWSTGASTSAVTVTSSANYSVTASTGGCTSTAGTDSVTVNPVPTAASIQSFTNNNTGNSLTVNWSNGGGNGVIVVGRLTTNSAVAPTSGAIYTSNTLFGTGSGSQLTGTNNYVVYIGQETSVGVTNLANGTSYTFTVYEYNVAGECYATGSSSAATTPASQTITFGPLADVTTGAADFSPGATASSGLTVSYTSSNTSVATIVSGNTHVVGVGTTTITASQAGNASYLAATSVEQIQVVIIAPSTAAAGDTTILFTQVSGDNDGFEFMTLKRLNLSTLEFTDNGICSNGLFRLNETNSISTNASAWTDVPSGTFVRILMDNSGTNGDNSYDGTLHYVNNTGGLSNSGEQVICYTGTANGASGCGGSGTNTYISGINWNTSPAGWLTTGTPDATTSYAPGTRTDFAINIGSHASLDFTGSIAGNVATLSGAASTGIRDASNWSSYSAGSSFNSDLTLKNILFNEANYSSGALALTANSSQLAIDWSGIAWTAGATTSSTRYMAVVYTSSSIDNAVDRYTCYVPSTVYGSAPEVVKSVTGQSANNTCGTPTNGNGYVVYLGYGTSATVTGLSAGSTYYVKVFAVNGNGYDANFSSTPATGNQAIKGTQTITFNALPDQVVGASPVTLTATASSGLTVTYTSSNTSVATVSGSTLTIVSAGATTITASQAGDSSYAAAAAESQIQTVITAPVTAVAGDIIFTQVSADNDGFEFMTLKRLNLSTLEFTNNGVCSNTLFRLNEINSIGTNVSVWTDIPEGTFVRILMDNSGNNGDNSWDGTLHYVDNNQGSLSTNGEQIICYTGTANGGSGACGGSGTNTYISGINWGPNGGWLTSGTPSGTTSYAPGTPSDFSISIGNHTSFDFTSSLTGNATSLLGVKATSGVIDTANWSNYSAGSSFSSDVTLKSILYNEANYSSGSLTITPTFNQMTIDWSGITWTSSATNSNTRYMALVYTTSSIDNAVDRYTCYVPNSIYGSAPAVVKSVTGQSANNTCGTATTGKGYVVYLGYGTSATVTGLAVGSTYYVKVFAVNGNGYDANFSSTAATGNQTITNTITTGTVSGSPFCAGSSGISVPFTYGVASNFTSGSTIFTAQLSDSSGNFTSPTTLQTVLSDGSGSQSISVTLPSTANGTSYRIRAVSNSPVVTGSNNGTNLVINGTPTVTDVDNCGSSTLTASNYTGTLSWSTGATTSSISVTTSGTYSVAQTVGGCTTPAGTATAAPLPVPSTPSVSVTNNCGSSVLSTTATGTLLWSNSATTSAITVTSSGAYTVTTTNGSGCTSSAGSGTAAPLTVPSTPSVSVTNNCGSSLLSTTATGTLLWSNSATTSAITVTASGAYTVTTTNGSGCTSSAGSGTAAPLTVPSMPSVSVTNNCGNSVLSTTSTGTLLWSNSATTSAITVTASGAYTVTTTNGSGCTSSAGSGTAAPLIVPSAPSISVTNNCGNSVLSTTSTGTLLWSNSATTSAITVTASGAYTVTTTNGSGCTSSAGSGTAAPLTVPSAPFVSVTNNCGNSVLSTTSTGTLLWSNSATTSAITVTSSGVYTVTTTNGSGCTSSAGSGTAAPLTVPSAPSVSVANNCGNSVLSTTATGTLLWSNSAITSAITVTASGAYTVTTTNGSGCISSAGSGTAAPLTVPSTPSVSVTNNCGSSLLSTTATGTLLWSNGATTSAITVTASGAYTVTTTNGSGCTSAAGSGTAAPLTVPSTPSVSVTNNCGSSLLSTTATGTLLWSNSATTSAITVTSSGAYTVTTTNGSGCTSSAGSGTGAPLTVPSAPSVSVTNNCGNSVLSTTSTGTLLWSNSATTSAITVTASGAYTVTTTNGSGCTSSAGSGTAAPLTVPSAPSISVTNNCGNSVLSTTSTGTLLWSNSATTSAITVTASGAYTVTTTNGSGCTSSVGSGTAAPLTVPSAPFVSVTNNCGNSVLSTTSTGTLLWSNSATTSAITVTVSGAYTVTTTNGSGCTSAAGSGTAAPLTVPSAPSVSVTNNCGNSVLSTTATGTLLWSNSATTSAITVTSSGVYTVTTTNGSGCTSSAGSGTAAPLTVPSAPSVSVTNNCGNSVLSTTATGTLLWSNSATTSAITVTSSGVYTVTTTNGSGCTSSVGSGTAAPLMVPSAPFVSVTNNCGNSVLSTTSTGTLLWSNSATTSAITVTASGAYTVTTTNGSGCTSSAGSGTAAPLTVPSAPSISVTNNCGNSVLSTTSTGTLLWSNSATTSAITVTASGAYTVTTTNGSGCTSSAGSGTAAPLTIPSAPSISIANNCDGTSVLSTAATGTLEWSTGASTSSVTVTESGTYSVTATAGTCTSPVGTGMASPGSSPSAPSVSVVNNCNGSSTLSTTATGGGLLWSTGATTSSITVTAAGTYSVTQTSGSCTSAAGTGVANLASCNFTFTVKFFIQGYYLGGGNMSSLLNLLNISINATDVDTASIELHNTSSPYAVVYSYKGILQSNGNLVCTFPGAASGNSYYIVIKHRNSLQTWSAAGVVVASGGSFDFTSNAGQAYSGNQVNVKGVYCIYSGDENQDGIINNSDYNSLRSALSSFITGVYNSNDATGDGIVDADDYRIMRNNVQLNLSAQYP